MKPFVIDTASRTLSFSDWCDDQRKWASLAKWRDELYPVYGDKSDPQGIALMVERASSYNFGIRTFGVHLNGTVRGEDGSVKMWVAKRSLQKQTWPGYLDQIVAGESVMGCRCGSRLSRSALEEGGIERDVAETTKFAGTIQYFTRSELGLQPETQFVFDLELPRDYVPYPSDGEVDSFHLWTLDEVVEKMRQNLFKPNCAVCVVDFLIRHGYLTPENEPDYLAILDNIHRPLPFPAPTY
ncbi:hypothetical protein DL89DRAFT_274661 [Linderina pennispora]|uniref:Nudix hydrolase domain-containing protein n=1 Tax=Linderina pennispora TaxID=61395 RepID=A0A1Y1WAW0_9FUNG|nr:uncharacterized protein DL89DRAFT_274661 [Linderina pennispora]ORX70669.1 hypothetical protein DL89DRAFT_274661 [Linderina pennispora]